MCDSDENYLLPKQRAVKAVIMKDTRTRAKGVTDTVNPSRRYFLQHCDKINPYPANVENMVSS